MFLFFYLLKKIFIDFCSLNVKKIKSKNYYINIKIPQNFKYDKHLIVAFLCFLGNIFILYTIHIYFII